MAQILSPRPSPGHGPGRLSLDEMGPDIEAGHGGLRSNSVTSADAAASSRDGELTEPKCCFARRISQAGLSGETILCSKWVSRYRPHKYADSGAIHRNDLAITKNGLATPIALFAKRNRCCTIVTGLKSHCQGADRVDKFRQI